MTSPHDREDDSHYAQLRTWSVDRIRAGQVTALRETVRAAYAAVPHYRQAFDAAGVHPSDIRRLDDLRRIPFTTKEDLRRGYPFGMFAVPRSEVVRIHASSGTTGRPTVVGYTRGDLDVWSEVMARSIHAAGGRPGDIVHAPTAMACSPAASGRTTAPSGWAARSCR